MGYCKDCKNGEIAKYGIYCNVYHHTYKEYDSCTRHFIPKTSSSSGCFLTTACVEAMGKSDDCLELTLLRNFRDTYIKQRNRGGEDIAEYYIIAPQIVSAISEQNNKHDIYLDIYNNLILKAIELIRNDKCEEAYFLYKRYVYDLKTHFLVS